MVSKRGVTRDGHRHITADTMAAEAPPSSLSASSGCDMITLLNNNDVILGRGTGPTEYIGNGRFRALIEQRQEDYNSIGGHNKHAEKKRIASEVIAQIHNLGGRFLRRVAVETPVDGTLPEEELWNEVEESVAVAKCQQALRDHRKKRRLAVGNGVRNNEGEENNESKGVTSSRAGFAPDITSGILYGVCDESVAAPPPLERAIHMLSAPLPVIPSNWMPALLWMPFGKSGADIADWRLSAFNHQAMGSQAPHWMNLVCPSRSHLDPSQNRNDVRAIPDADALASQDILLLRTDGIVPEYGLAAENVTGSENKVEEFERKGSCCNVARARPSTLEADFSSASSQAELSEYLLSLLISNRPMITEEQVELEQAAMTDEERAAALADLFGKKCTVDEHQSKRARKDLDRDSIEFLVKMMRLELERIPKDEKRVLVEAQAKCHADEFSDSRLERFLRCEGMDVKRGARRFVNYWESRQKVFGPDKFVLRMTLGEALCDDLAAIEACWYRPLPHLDQSGRQLLLMEPCRHTREGYTSEGMIRAVWYVMEVMAQENTDMGSGVVLLISFQNFTMWDYDHELYSRILSSCWPVNIIARHGCFPPSILKIIKPILNALVDKHTRSRVLMHDVPESEILDVLSSYGVQKYMLPTQLGGTVLLDQAKWIASRMAAELEDI